MKILLVEDDEALIAILTRSLAAQHYVVDAVRDGELGWTYSSTFEYDLIVLDIVLPKLDGISLCKRLRTEGYSTPVLLLTAQDNSTAKVQGLDAGADDYVVKPFDQAELIARIRALLRRGSTNPFPLLTWGDLLLNPSTCEVSYNSQPLSLTTKEYELLELLLRDSQHVFSTDELLDRLWSSEEFPSEATVRSHIRRVRRKLASVGAPQDFIATMHGRGYYLKAPKTQPSTAATFSDPQGDAVTVEASFSTALQSGPKPSPGGTHSLDSQQQYLAFLNETWTTTKPKSLDQTAVLLETVRQLQADRLTPQQQTEAQQVVHRLAGTLGVFGLTKTTHLARQLEYWLGGREPLQPKHAPLMKTLVTALQQEIQNTVQIEQFQTSQEQSPLLLLISADQEFNQSLMTIATSCGIGLEIVARPESVFEVVKTPPNAILFRLSASASVEPSAISHLLETLQLLARRYPTLPILVMGDRGELSDRLEILRRGGKLFLEAATPPEQVMATVVNLLKGGEGSNKVMVVDDDGTWLSTLPTLLKPWGFKVTTLADPQQFWTVLQAVMPDALILDINMPQINGFELCQILRSDPRWQRLPVLFLSVLTDSATQHQAFTVGADDYLCKPVMGVELANRILNRLHRVRAWAS